MLAAANRYWLMPRLAQQDRLLSVLVRTIAMEQALAAAVLLAVSALGLVNPSM
jgi:putative copper export protein